MRRIYSWVRYFTLLPPFLHPFCFGNVEFSSPPPLPVRAEMVYSVTELASENKRYF